MMQPIFYIEITNLTSTFYMLEKTNDFTKK